MARCEESPAENIKNQEKEVKIFVFLIGIPLPIMV
jgi:hypothetical protein